MRVHLVYSFLLSSPKSLWKPLGRNSWKLREMSSYGWGIISTQCCRAVGRYFHQISGEMKSIVFVTTTTAGRGPHFQCWTVTSTSIMYRFHWWNILAICHVTNLLKGLSQIFFPDFTSVMRYNWSGFLRSSEGDVRDYNSLRYFYCWQSNLWFRDLSNLLYYILVLITNRGALNDQKYKNVAMSQCCSVANKTNNICVNILHYF